MKEREPWTVQAAKASWLAPLVALGVGFATNIMMSGNRQVEPATVRTIWLTVGGICILLVLIGFICGIFALFGIRRHGAMRTLLPAVIGLLLCSGYTYLIVVAVLVAKQAAERNMLAP
jgi:hypothetical protein